MRIFTKSLPSELLSSVFRGGAEVQSSCQQMWSVPHSQPQRTQPFSPVVGDLSRRGILGAAPLGQHLVNEEPPPRLGISEVSSIPSPRTQSAPSGPQE